MSLLWLYIDFDMALTLPQAFNPFLASFFQCLQIFPRIEYSMYSQPQSLDHRVMVLKTIIKWGRPLS